MPRHSRGTLFISVFGVLLSCVMLGNAIHWYVLTGQFFGFTILWYINGFYGLLSILLIFISWIYPIRFLYWMSVVLYSIVLLLAVVIPYKIGLFKWNQWLEYVFIALLLSPNWLAVHFATSPDKDVKLKK